LITVIRLLISTRNRTGTGIRRAPTHIDTEVTKVTIVRAVLEYVITSGPPFLFVVTVAGRNRFASIVTFDALKYIRRKKAYLYLRILD